LLPVDAHGVLLPPEDFTPEEALRYPRVSGLASSPLGPIGTRWGNPVVESAAMLAELLQPAAWQELKLHHISQQSASSGETPMTAVLQVETREGTQFVWGKMPGKEGPGEPKANEKLARMQKLANQHGGLDKVPETQRDLRQSVSST
jgi:hypothetical protein